MNTKAPTKHAAWTVRLELDRPTFDKLVARAVAARRPLAWQAELELARALGAALPAEEAEAAAR